MILELHILTIVMAVIFMVLSWIETEDFKPSPVYVWIAVILCFILAAASLDIRIVTCDTIVNTINTSVANLNVMNTTWDCSEYLIQEIGFSWFWMAMGIVHLVWAIIQSILVAGSAGKDMGKNSPSD